MIWKGSDKVSILPKINEWQRYARQPLHIIILFPIDAIPIKSGINKTGATKLIEFKLQAGASVK